MEYSSFWPHQKKIDSFLIKIDCVLKSSPTPQSFAEEILLKQELEELLIKEEILWKNKSKELWLTCKDLKY